MTRSYPTCDALILDLLQQATVQCGGVLDSKLNLHANKGPACLRRSFEIQLSHLLMT